MTTSADSTIDRFKTLIMVDPWIVGSEFTKNRQCGALSFASLMENANPSGFRLILGDTLEQSFDEVVPQEDTSLTGCPLADAHARLIAVSNRLDLADHADSQQGEFRLAFAVTDGPADDDTPELQMTLILEYRLDVAFSLQEWAVRFAGLSLLTGDDYLSALVEIANDTTRPSNLSQVRVLDARGADGFFLELTRDPRGDWRLNGLRNTPDVKANGTGELAANVLANAEAIFNDSWLMPEPMAAALVRTSDGPWGLPGVSEALRHAFALGTCNGCHGQEAPAHGFFHIAPGASARERLSRFLNDDNPADDELARRQRLLESWLPE